MKQFTRAVPRKEKCLTTNSDRKILKNTLRLLSNSTPTNLTPYVDRRTAQSNAVFLGRQPLFRSAGSVDSTGREIGITSVIYPES